MRFLLGLALCVNLLGCGSFPTLNSDSPTPKSTRDMKKACGCAGHETCSTMTNCGQCCTPDDCKCQQITQNIKCNSCGNN